jgi:hypothetical protein
METLNRRWLIPLCGIASMLAFAVHGFVAGSLPADDASAVQIMDYATGHHRALLVAAWLDGLGAVLLLLFVVGVVHSASTRATTLGRIAFMGTGLVAALSLVVDLCIIAMGQAGARGDTSSAVTAFHLAVAGDLVFPLANVVWVTALAAILLRAELVPAAVACVGLAFGAAELVLGPLALATSGNLDQDWFMVFPLWIIAVAVAVGVRGGPRREPVAADLEGTLSGVRA